MWRCKELDRNCVSTKILLIMLWMQWRWGYRSSGTWPPGGPPAWRDARSRWNGAAPPPESRPLLSVDQHLAWAKNLDDHDCKVSSIPGYAHRADPPGRQPDCIAVEPDCLKDRPALRLGNGGDSSANVNRAPPDRVGYASNGDSAAGPGAGQPASLAPVQRAWPRGGQMLINR